MIDGAERNLQSKSTSMSSAENGGCSPTEKRGNRSDKPRILIDNLPEKRLN